MVDRLLFANDDESFECVGIAEMFLEIEIKVLDVLPPVFVLLRHHQSQVGDTVLHLLKYHVQVFEHLVTFEICKPMEHNVRTEVQGNPVKTPNALLLRLHDAVYYVRLQ